MGMFRSAAKTGIAMKVLSMVRREAAKPQNQAKARQLLGRVTDRSAAGRTAGRRYGRRPPGSH